MRLVIHIPIDSGDEDDDSVRGQVVAEVQDAMAQYCGFDGVEVEDARDFIRRLLPDSA